MGGSGGGAGGAGVAAGAHGSGNSGKTPGGAGLSSSISGFLVTYATGGTGGEGWGATSAGEVGAANRGNGGGGGGWAFWPAGAGGSGIVILSYPTGTLTATGGTITTSGGNTIHTFTSSGTFQITRIFTGFGVYACPTNRFKQMCADRLASSSGGAAFTNNPKWAAMGAGATSASRCAASSDTGLSLELYSRVAGTVTLLGSSSGGPVSDTIRNDATIVATSSGRIDEFTLNDSSSSGDGHAVLSSTFDAVNVERGDSIQFTTLITFI
jgi:hypothetical protein